MSRRNAPELFIPEPRLRPGDKPDFSNLDIPPVGALDKPDEMVDFTEIPDHARSMIRVLDDDHRAKGDWNPHLDAETLRGGLRNMLKTRVYDERMLKMQRQGKMSFYMKCTGEEAVAVAQATALRPSDMLFATYRQQGLLITRGHSMLDMMCHCLSNSRDYCKGRQMPIFYTWRDGNYFSISGSVGTQFSQAVGWAMAAAYKGQDDIACTWVGDGTTAEADFHYALTFAAVYRAPVILNVVNNQWAISSFQGIAGGISATFANRGRGYGLPGLRVDGNDFLAVYAATQWAANRARRGGGATLIEHYTYRADAHSTSDDPSKYRPRKEWEAWPLGDPIERLKNHLIVLGEWSEEQHEELRKELEEEVAALFREAESYGTLHTGPRPDINLMFEDVYEEMPLNLRRQRQQVGV